MMKTESGRSMVEMLGVLAIIGVLSVGGIAGYTTAMKKYKANEAAQELSMISVLCATQGNADGLEPKLVTLGACNTTTPQSGDGSFTFTLKASEKIDCTTLAGLSGSIQDTCTKFVVAS